MNRKLFTALLCLLLVAATVFVSCDFAGGDGEETTAATTEAATTGATTAATTAGTTAATTAGTTAATTTAATTAGTTAATTSAMPTLLRPTITDTNVVLTRLETPFNVEVYNGYKVNLQYQGWATVDTKDGTNVYMASSVRKEHVDPHGAVAFSKSTDGGKTWSQMKLVIDTPLDDRDTGIVDLGNGHIAIVWFTRQASDYMPGGILVGNWEAKATPEEKEAVWARYEALNASAGSNDNSNPMNTVKQGSYMIHSYDNGETWDTANIVRIPIFAPHGPTRMNDGGLVYLGMAWNDRSKSNDPAGGRRLYVYTSHDEGLTWKMHGIMITPGDTGENVGTEPHIIQLRNGSFVGTFRRDVNEYGMECYIVHSKDGVTWDEPVMIKDMKGGPPHLLELENGAIILTYGYRVSPQCGVRVRISYDHGKTWGRENILEISDTPTNSDLGYPVTIALADGSLLTAYYQKNGSDKYCSVLGTRWTVK